MLQNGVMQVKRTSNMANRVIWINSQDHFLTWLNSPSGSHS